VGSECKLRLLHRLFNSLVFGLVPTGDPDAVRVFQAAWEEWETPFKLSYVYPSPMEKAGLILCVFSFSYRRSFEKLSAEVLKFDDRSIDESKIILKTRRDLAEEIYVALMEGGKKGRTGTESIASTRSTWPS
jgi:hypothetical protein